MKPTVRLAGRSWPVYGLCVCGGALLAAAWMTVLAAAAGTSPRWALLQALIGILAALALAYATKAFAGGERFTFYHYQLVVLLAGGTAAAWMGRPALAGLDVLAVGLAVAHGVGRLGCLAAGCCHGRAVPWGIRYGHDHAAEGFPRRFVGVPLAPVQLFESLALLALAGAGSWLAVAAGAADGPRAGSALALYVAGYGVVRFFLERWRGDRRPTWLGVSEAQWTALLAVGAVDVLIAAGALPLGDLGAFAGWASLLALVVVAMSQALGLRRGRQLLDGPHATELAAMLLRLQASDERSGDGTIATSSRGMRVSSSLLAERGRMVRLVTFSAGGTPLAASGARAMARRFLQWCPGAAGAELLGAREPGMWHLLMQLPPTEGRQEVRT